MNNNDITIWRFNLHTHEGTKNQIKTFEYCEANKIIGTGWGTNIRLMDSKDENITEEEFNNRLNKFDFSNQKGFKQSMRSLKEMKKDDLIWTRKNNIYYICRVTGKAKDFMPGDRPSEIENDIYDIWHYVPCEFIEIGTEEKILGTIVRSFNMGVICHIKGKGEEDVVKEFSKKVYNDYKKIDYYEINKPKNKWNYFWNYMGALEIEEIVGLYMQIKLEYGVYTSTNKKDTKEYEYVLFKRDNPKETAKLQVKTSNINLDIYNLEKDSFYFFTIGNYWKDGKNLNEEELKEFEKNNKVIFLTKKELLKFVKENQRFLPYRVNWF